MSSLPSFESALTQLIASPSISSTQSQWDQGNSEIINLLAAWFESLGFEISIDPVPRTKNKFNLLAKLGSGEGGLLLAGHSDTVPYDEKRWLSDPFQIKNQDDKFYGLGTCDMKGFFAFILEAAKSIDKKLLKKPFYVLATADEETTMAGARFFAQKQMIKPDAAVIGEPTSLVPVIMHKGHMSHRISIEGKSGHSSQPTLGVNAIEIVHKVIGELLLLKEKLGKKYNNQNFDVPYPTLNLGAINGGDNANRICGHCTLDLDIRSLPGLSDDELILFLHDQLQPLMQIYPNRISIEELHPSSPSFAEDTNASLVTLSEELSGHKCCAVNYATEAPYIQQLGCQTIVLGPGSIDQAHQPNEFLPHDEIHQTNDILNKLIIKYCL